MKDMNVPPEAPTKEAVTLADLQAEVAEHVKRGEGQLVLEGMALVKLLRLCGGTLVLRLDDAAGEEHIDHLRSPLVDHLMQIEVADGTSLLRNCDEKLAQCIAASSEHHKPSSWALSLSISVPGQNQVFIDTAKGVQPRIKTPYGKSRGVLRQVDLNAPHNLADAPKRQPQLPGVSGKRLTRRYLK